MRQLVLVFLLFMTFSVLASTKVAVVKLIRGDVRALVLGKTIKLKLNDWVEQGAMVKTGEKSFVKIVFLDKSQMNVGPNSEMKIEKFTGKDSGVIDLVKGKIRSQVTKDYLQMQNKDKSKLFIKTQNAVMGVRGTDFMISTNGASTSTILFEGEVVFNRLDNRSETSSARLEEVVDRGVRIYPGEFSVMEPTRSMPTVPSLLNIQQREKLENNQDFSTERAPSNSSTQETAKNIVPEGLSGKTVANTTDVLKNELPSMTEKAPKTDRASTSQPEGYVKGDLVKPANGSIIHIDSGVIIPPGAGSILDPNTNTFIPGQDVGKISADGNFVPPKNVEITNEGKIFVAINDGGKIRVQEVEKPIPVVTEQSTPLGKIGNVIEKNPRLMNRKKAVSNDILNAQFVPSGITDISNNNLNESGGISGINEAAGAAAATNTTIIIRPTDNQ